MTKIIKEHKSYIALRKDLDALLSAGRKRALQVIAELRNQTYWRMGQRLSGAREISSPGQARALMGKLAKDLGIASSILYRALQFFQAYPDGLPDRTEFRSLSWAVHAELLPVRDADQRAFYLQNAIRQNWSSKAVRRAVRSNLYQATQAGAPSPHPLDRPRLAVHNYVATVERIIDGDTLIVRIDLGFRTHREETIRLRGIDAPERHSPAGRAATKFITQALAKIDPIVVHTYKTDKYARYVADIFYHPELKDKDAIFSQGKFLNQEILNHGHAQVAHWG